MAVHASNGTGGNDRQDCDQKLRTADQEKSIMSQFLDDDLTTTWPPSSPIAGDPPIVITSAKSIYLETEDGRRIIDGISSWWVNTHGHSHPAIAEAIYKQAKELEHVIFAGFT